MPKYRKKPVVIDAEQWFPPGHENYVEGKFKIFPDLGIERTEGRIYEKDGVYEVQTLEGPLNISTGDFIITGVKGERYPCKPDVFERTYDLA